MTTKRSKPESKELPVLREHELGIVMVPISDIAIISNPKIHPEEQIRDMVESIRKFGFTDPCLLSRDGNTLVAGYCRLEAARRLELQEVPCRYTDLHPDEFLAYILSEGRIGEKATWNYDIFIDWYTTQAGEEGKAMLVGWKAEDIDDIIRWQEEHIRSVNLTDFQERPLEETPTAPPTTSSWIEVALSFPLSVWNGKRREIETDLATMSLKYEGVRQSQPKVRK